MEGQSVSVYGHQAHESLIHERSCNASPNSPIPLSFGWSTYRAGIYRLLKYSCDTVTSNYKPPYS